PGDGRRRGGPPVRRTGAGGTRRLRRAGLTGRATRARRVRVPVPAPKVKAATTRGPAGARGGATTRPSGGGSPESSKTIAPSHVRVQPCSGRATATCGAGQSVRAQDGWWAHMAHLHIGVVPNGPYPSTMRPSRAPWNGRAPSVTAPGHSRDG